MSEISVGDMVVSLCGHDVGGYFIVMEVDGKFVTVCDGHNRKAVKKKKKSIKHVMPTGQHTELIKNVPQYAVDANIRREIKRLKQLI